MTKINPATAIRLATAVLVSLSLLLLSSPPANAAVTGSVSVAILDAPQDSYECPCEPGDLTFKVSTPDSLQYIYYTFEVRVTDPSGDYVTSHTSDLEVVGGSWRWPVYLFPGMDEYGTYTVTGTARFYVDAGNTVDDTKTATTTFAFSGPTKPASPTIENLPDRMTAVTFHRPKVTSVLGTATTSKHHTVVDTRTHKVVSGRALRNIKPGRYRIQSEVHYSLTEEQVHTGERVLTPAVPERSVTKTWAPSECTLTEFTPARWSADQVLWQKRLDMSGPPPGVWVEAIRITGRTSGLATYSCPMDDGTRVTKSAEAVAHIAWTTATPDDYRFVFGWPNPVTTDGVMQVTQEDFTALRASIYWAPGTTSGGCDDNPYTPCSPNAMPISYSYKDADHTAPSHYDRLLQIEPAVIAGPVDTTATAFSHTYVVPEQPAVTEPYTWTETVTVALDQIKRRSQYVRVVR